MSKPALLACAAALLAAASPALAISMVPADGHIPNYALVAADLSDFHGGIQGSAAKRNVERDGWETEMKANRIDGYLGYDLTRWLSIYALGGIIEVKNDRAGVEKDTVFAFGGGFWAGLIDDDQLDFLPTIGRYRRQAGGEVVHADPADLSWTEFNAFLTFEILNDLFLAEAYAPDAIGIFFGPVFHGLDVDDFEKVEDNDWGFTVGMKLHFADGVYVNGGADLFNDDQNLYFNLGVRF